MHSARSAFISAVTLTGRWKMSFDCIQTSLPQFCPQARVVSAPLHVQRRSSQNGDITTAPAAYEYSYARVGHMLRTAMSRTNSVNAWGDSQDDCPRVVPRSVC